eukprot:9894556-Karenia_brevis.AAC.1
MGRIRKERSRDEEEIKLTAQLTARKPFGCNGAPKRAESIRKARSRDGELTAQLTAWKPFNMESRPQKGPKGWRGCENNGAEARNR